MRLQRTRGSKAPKSPQLLQWRSSPLAGSTAGRWWRRLWYQVRQWRQLVVANA